MSLPTSLKHTGEAEVYIHTFVTSVIDGDKLSASHSGQFTPGKEDPYPWSRKLGRRAGMDNCKGREVLNVAGHRTRTVQPVARSLRNLATCHVCYGPQNWSVTVPY